MELLPSHAFSTLVRDYRRGVYFFFGLKLEIRDRLTSTRQKNILFFFFFPPKFPVLQENLDVYMGLQQFIVTSGTSRHRSLARFLFRPALQNASDGPDWTESTLFFFNVGFLTPHPPPPHAGRRLNISAENDCRRLHCSLRDLSSLLQAVGRLAEHFIGEIFAARFSDALAVVERSACRTLSNMQNDFEPTATEHTHVTYLLFIFYFNQYWLLKINYIILKLPLSIL